MYKFHINGKNSEWNFVNIVRDLLRDDPEWEEIVDKDDANKTKLHYCDLDEYNPIVKNYIKADAQFVNKDFLALAVGNSKHVPLSLVIKNGRMLRTKQSLSPNSRNGKWFLKPVEGYGGRGIEIFMGVNNYHRFTKRGRNYVLQPEVSDPMLYKGRKFDIRSFVAMVYLNGRYYLYLYPDSICRVSLTKYSKKSVNKNSDLTNCSVQVNHTDYSTEKINKLMSGFPWYEEVLPKLNHIVGCCLRKMKSSLKRPANDKIVEVIALDTLITKKKDIILLEVNRNVGYGYNCKPDYVVDMYKKMYRDLINFAYIPIIKDENLKDPKEWLKCTIF